MHCLPCAAAGQSWQGEPTAAPCATPRQLAAPLFLANVGWPRPCLRPHTLKPHPTLPLWAPPNRPPERTKEMLLQRLATTEQQLLACFRDEASTDLIRALAGVRVEAAQRDFHLMQLQVCCRPAPSALPAGPLPRACLRWAVLGRRMHPRCASHRAAGTRLAHALRHSRDGQRPAGRAAAQGRRHRQAQGAADAGRDKVPPAHQRRPALDCPACDRGSGSSRPVCGSPGSSVRSAAGSRGGGSRGRSPLLLTRGSKGSEHEAQEKSGMSSLSCFAIHTPTL